MIAQDISVIGMNLKQVYSEWYDTLSDQEIGNVYILRELTDIREGKPICDFFIIGNVDFIISDLFVNYYS